MTYKLFENYVNEEVQKINFNQYYDNILNKNIYTPEKILEMIQLTTYHLQYKKKMNDNIAGTLGYNRSVLDGTDSEKKELNKLELLYIVTYCDALLNNKTDNDKHSSLYM